MILRINNYDVESTRSRLRNNGLDIKGLFDSKSDSITVGRQACEFRTVGKNTVVTLGSEEFSYDLSKHVMFATVHPDLKDSFTLRYPDDKAPVSVVVPTKSLKDDEGNDVDLDYVFRIGLIQCGSLGGQ